MGMLCSVLQCEDVRAVQAWLVSAGDQGKVYFALQSPALIVDFNYDNSEFSMTVQSEF